MKKTIKLLNGKRQIFFIVNEKNPCECGSNLFYLVNEGEYTKAYCNVCNEYIYVYKEKIYFDEEEEINEL